MKKYVPAVLIVVAVIAIIVLVNPQKEKGQLTIGVIMALSGDSANYGQEARNALEIAKDEINQSGGIKGQSVRFIYEDGKCDSKTASQAAKKLTNVDQVRIIIGEVCSGATIAIVEAVSPNRVLVFSPISTSPKLTGKSPLFVRNAPSDALAAKQTAELAKSKGFTNGAVVFEQTDFAQALADRFTQGFKSLGGNVVLSESYPAEGSDIRTQLTKVKSSEAEFVYLVPQHPTTGARLARQAKELGIPQVILGNEYFSNPELLAAVGGAANGIEFFVASDPSGTLTDEFLQKYKSRYGEGASLLQYTPNSYDALMIVKQATEKNGLDPAKIGSSIRQIRNYQGVSGTYSFTSEGDVEKGYSRMKIVDGKAELVQ